MEKFCLTDAFPKPTSSRALSALRQAIFPSRAAKFVRQNADRFDVIDCLIGTLPFAKESLGFQGLVVARSIGLHRLYERFDLLSRERWPDQPKGRLFGSLFHKLRARRLRRNADEAIRRCDLLNLPNENELEELEKNVRIRRPAIVEPYGLNDQYRAAFAQSAQPAEVRLAKKKICFIGMWSLRKGSRDWPELMRRIWEKVPRCAVRFSRHDVQRANRLFRTWFARLAACAMRSDLRTIRASGFWVIARSVCFPATSRASASPSSSNWPPESRR